MLSSSHEVMSPRPRLAFRTALAAFGVATVLAWLVLSPGSAPVGAATEAEQAAWAERMRWAREFKGTGPGWEARSTPTYQVESQRLAKAITVRADWETSWWTALALSMILGSGAGWLTFLLLRHRRVTIQVSDAGLLIDGVRVPRANLRRALRKAGLIQIDWEDGARTFAQGTDWAASLFALEEVLQQRVPSAQAQSAEREARDALRSVHARLMQQVGR